jgi:MFS family permease
MSNFFSLSAYMGSMFYVPLYFQAVEGLSATGAGLRLIPVMVCSVSGSLFGGKVMQKTGKYYWLTISCIAVSILGTVTLFFCSGLVFDSSWGVTIGLCLGAFGGGAAITTTLINVIASADPKDQAIATACTYLFRSLGSVVGVTISATVVQQTLRTQLKKNLNSRKEADKIVEKVRQSLDFIKTLEPGTRDIVRICYERATNASFGVSIGIVCLSLVAAGFIRETRLSK